MWKYNPHENLREMFAFEFIMKGRLSSAKRLSWLFHTEVHSLKVTESCNHTPMVKLD